MKCLLCAHIAIVVLQCLGFGINFEKSSLIPKQSIEHLGLEWNSVLMTVSLSAEKVNKVTSLASKFISDGGCTHNKLRSFVGRLESTHIIKTQTPLPYRHLQRLLPRLLSHGSVAGKVFL